MGGRGRWISEFKINQVYRLSSRTDRATERNPVLTNKQNNNRKDLRVWIDIIVQRVKTLSIQPSDLSSVSGPSGGGRELIPARCSLTPKRAEWHRCSTLVINEIIIKKVHDN